MTLALNDEPQVDTPPRLLAEAIAMRLRADAKVRIHTEGLEDLARAVQAVAIAGTEMSREGVEILCHPEFDDLPRATSGPIRVRISVERKHPIPEHIRRLLEQHGPNRDEEKHVLLRAIAHDLRSRLTPIIGFAETLVSPDRDLSPDLRDDMARRIVRQGRVIERTLNELLDLEHAESGVLVPHVTTMDLDAALGEIVADIHDASHPISLDVAPCLVSVDLGLLRRIVENLVSNAIAHTPPGTPIVVRGSGGPDATLIEVEDRGPGIPDELKSAIFSPFRRGDAVAAGSGVGLALVERFARLHGGAAWVEDAADGGACFRVWLAGLRRPSSGHGRPARPRPAGRPEP